LNQWETPKQSTKAFAKFIEAQLSRSKKVIDLAAGTGAPTAYLAELAPDVEFLATDSSSECVELGKKISNGKGLKNLNYKHLNWYELQPTDGFDGVISIQTLSWLKEPKEPLRLIFERLKPEWVGVTSLFYEGDISCTIEVNMHSIKNKLNYNIYSMKEIERIANSSGYKIYEAKKFDIDIDIPKPSDLDLMGTYTRRFGDEPNRVQISGPLMMPWYMVMFEKIYS
jgi:ubiquinone/menaquinone biosynthesis C-methylase UbiE